MNPLLNFAASIMRAELSDSRRVTSPVNWSAIAVLLFQVMGPSEHTLVWLA
jgi:hypothetical protein